MKCTANTSSRGRGLVFAMLWLAGSSSLLGESTEAKDAPPPSASKGATLWADNCGRCHNMRDPMEFRDDQWRVIVYHMRLRSGLDGQQTRDILAFLQNANGSYWNEVALETKPDNSATGAPAASADVSSLSGQQLYDRACIACHGKNGQGAIPGVPNFNDPKGPLSKTDAQLELSILQGVQRPNTPLAMPPQGGDSSVGPEEAHQLVEYLRSAFGS